MRHISLDESFWRSATEALVSGECIDDVEPGLLDVSRLLHLLYDPSGRAPAGRLGLLTLGDTEEERALGLTLAALVARRGARVLAADCDFTDDTWSRLLGADELDGVVDHVAYGVPPTQLVRATSWSRLSFLPSGTAALDASGILRSDKLAACLAALGRGHDLVCIGLPFDESLEWGRGVTAGMDRVVLLAPAGDELAFELAIPRLVRRVEVVVTIDVPPLGRWRPGLGAALPALTQPAELEPVPAAALAPDGPASRVEAEGSRPASDAAPGLGAPAAGGPALGVAPGSPDAAPVLTSDVASVAARANVPENPRALPQPAADLPLFEADDPEAAADVAFLQDLERAEPAAVEPADGHSRVGGRDDPSAGRVGAGASSASAAQTRVPPLVHPRLRTVALQHQLELTADESETSPTSGRGFEELAEGWRDVRVIPEDDAREAPEEREGDESSGRGFWLTAGSLLLCLALGAGAFWYWRATQSVPEGQFTYFEPQGAAAAQGGPGVASGGVGGGAGPAVPEIQGGSEPSPAAEAGGASRAEAAGDPGPAKAPTAEADPARAVAVPGVAQPGEAQGAGQGPASGPTFDPPKAGPLLPYSLHVGSYQTFDAAQHAAVALRAQGLNAFVTPVLLEGKGEWYRVFAETLPDAPASQARLAGARAAGAVREAAVRETPWTLYLGTFPSQQGAGQLIDRLARSGVSGYAEGEGPVHVYAGAFESAGDAEILNRKLRDRGFDSALVRRRGAEGR